MVSVHAFVPALDESILATSPLVPSRSYKNMQA